MARRVRLRQISQRAGGGEIARETDLAGASFTIELERRYWYAVADCIARTRDLARRARNQGSREA